MKVLVKTSEGTLLVEQEIVVDGDGDVIIRLTENHEVTVWSESGRRLHRRLDHLDALQSREIHYRSYADGPMLRDGTPLTDEIMESWGWSKQPDGSWSVTTCGEVTLK